MKDEGGHATRAANKFGRNRGGLSDGEPLKGFKQ